MQTFNNSKYIRRTKKRLMAAFKRVLDSGFLINGPECEKLEREWEAFTGSKYAVGVASGTDALFLSMKALGIGVGDHVVTVPNTALPTVSAIVATGAKPVFADIDTRTYLATPETIAASITPKTKAVVVVHLYGQSARVDEILGICKKHGVDLIEDCAQAHGCMYRGKHVGTYGICGCFSFYPTKNLGAFGDGGAIITNRGSLRDRLRLLKNYGQLKRDVCVMPGYNSRLDEVQAALIRATLPDLEPRNRQRLRIARWYNQYLKDTAISLPTGFPNETSHVYHQYVVRVKHRDRVIEHMELQGVATSIHYPVPIYLQKGHIDPRNPRGCCPNSESAQKSILSLPMYPELTRCEVRHVASALKNAIGSSRE